VSLLDTLLLGYKVIVRKGIVSAQRPAIEFTGDGVVVTDDPINDRALVAISSIPNVATNSLVGRDTPGTGPAETISLDPSLGFVSPQVLGVANGGITNAKHANMAAATIKGRAFGAGTGVPVDLTATQVQTILQDGWANISFGVNPSTAANAAIRLPHGMRGLSYRNQANSADVTLASYGLVANDVGAFGNTAAFHIRTESAIARVRNNATDLMTWESAQIESVVPVWRFQRDVVTPVLCQENKSVAGACQPLVVRAQGTSVAATAGGDLMLDAGKAGTGGNSGRGRLRGERAAGGAFDEALAWDTSGAAGRLGFYGTAPGVKPTITGTRADGAALGTLLTSLAALGLLTDSSTAGSGGGGGSLALFAGINTSFAATTTNAAVSSWTELVDTGAYHDTVTNPSRLNITSGTWVIIANVGAASSAGNTIEVQIVENGTDIRGLAQGADNAAGDGCAATAMAIVSGNAADFFEVFVKVGTNVSVRCNILALQLA
jgi:hypothetical protein